MMEDPAGLTVTLMAHQSKALAWMTWRESQVPSGGILGKYLFSPCVTPPTHPPIELFCVVCSSLATNIHLHNVVLREALFSLPHASHLFFFFCPRHASHVGYSQPDFRVQSLDIMY